MKNIEVKQIDFFSNITYVISDTSFQLLFTQQQRNKSDTLKHSKTQHSASSGTKLKKRTALDRKKKTTEKSL